MKQKPDDCSFLTDEDRAKINELLTNHPFSEKDLEDGMQQLMKFNVNDKPNKMKIIYTWHDLGRYAKNAAKSLLRGLIRLVWVIVLLVVNIIATALNWVKNAIKKKMLLVMQETFSCKLQTLDDIRKRRSAPAIAIVDILTAEAAANYSLIRQDNSIGVTLSCRVPVVNDPGKKISTAA